MKRQQFLSAAVCVAALGVVDSTSAMAQAAPLYWSWGMSAPGIQVGISNAPMLNLPPVVYAPPRPAGYGYGYPVAVARPAPYPYAYGGPVRYGVAPGYRYDRDDFNRHGWRHEHFEREHRGWGQRF